jgi:hypothetical protein
MTKMTIFISCERTEDSPNLPCLLGTSEVLCNNGDVSIDWLSTANINTQNRAYQREKVTNVKWKQDVLLTILYNTFAGIPEIHIRVIENEGGGYRFELIDGQQRVTAVFDFLNNDYALPPMVVDGCDIGGMKIDKLRETYPAIYDRIMQYRVTCKWYEGVTDLQTSFLFTEILNKTTDMKYQEIRNAVLGFYSDYIRNTARFEPHNLFTRVIEKSGKKDKTVLKYFSSGFKLLGRMEVDEWLSELLYLKLNGVRKGLSQTKHTDWVKGVSSPNGEYINKFTDQKMADDLLNFALNLLKATPKKFEVRLNSMTSMMIVLYADDMRQRFGNVIPEKFVPAFFDVYTRWSDTKKKLYMNETMLSGKQMEPFSELFGGKNSNAIGTIFKVLDMEFGVNPLTGDADRRAEVGILDMDMRKTFNRVDIIKKWQEQGALCYYTGEPIEEDNLAGDHFIPRSWGIAQGGVTEYDNLVVCSKNLNNKKSNMSGDEFKEMLKTKEAA